MSKTCVGGLVVGDAVLVTTDTGEQVPGTFRGVDGVMVKVELDTAGCKAMGYARAGEHWVSGRRIKAKDGVIDGNNEEP